MTQYDNTEGEIPVLRWSNRRRMAWLAFTTLVAGTVVYWFLLPLWFHFWTLPTTWLGTIGDSYSWFASAMTLTIAAYLGFNSLSSMRKFNPMTPRVSRQSSSYDDDDYEPREPTSDEPYDPSKIK